MDGKGVAAWKLPLIVAAIAAELRSRLQAPFHHLRCGRGGEAAGPHSRPGIVEV